MLYAGSLRLDRRDIRMLKITDPYSVHRTVYSLFENIRREEDLNSSVTSGILYADKGGDFDGRRILVVANRPPDIARLGGCGVLEIKQITDAFLSHDRYRFKIMLNPTRRDSKSRKLMPIKDRTEILDWFTIKAEKSGFALVRENFSLDAIEVLNFAAKERREITLNTATISGILHVVDAANFKKSFAEGIGRARAFGCGLLQIVPI